MRILANFTLWRVVCIPCSAGIYASVVRQNANNGDENHPQKTREPEAPVTTVFSVPLSLFPAAPVSPPQSEWYHWSDSKRTISTAARVDGRVA
jgi:hypothetical protein